MSKDQFEYVLRAGDDALILGQQLGFLTGHGPVIEEDIALTNIGLDQIGQARAWLSLAGRLEHAASSERTLRDEDALAFLRDAPEFRNCLLVERPNGDFGDTIARQFLYDNYAVLWLEAMTASSHDEMAGIAAKSVKEARYHLQHSSRWVLRLGDGTAESHSRVQASLERVWPYVNELFDADELTTRAASEGWGVDPSKLRSAWDAGVNAVLAEATLTRPHDGFPLSGGRTGSHTEAFGFMLAEMQFLQRAYPDCNW